MHPEAYNFVASFTKGKKFESVLEYGSRNINGSVRDLFDTDDYHGIDLYPGLGVDEVADAVEYFVTWPYQCVVCCEVLEHTPMVAGVVRSASVNLKTCGYFVVTCAADPREPHSSIDGGPLQDGEYYNNVELSLLTDLCRRYQLRVLLARLVRSRGDLYLVAQRH